MVREFDDSPFVVFVPSGEDDSPDVPDEVEQWVEETSAFDRVQSIATVLSQFRSASYVADEASVAENTARAHLERLVDLSVLLKREDSDGVKYRLDPLHHRAETLRKFLEEFDIDGLIDRKADIQERLAECQEKYDVDSPQELRKLAADTDSAEATRDIKKDASDWELARYRLDIVEDAIENYDKYTFDPAT